MWHSSSFILFTVINTSCFGMTGFDSIIVYRITHLFQFSLLSYLIVFILTKPSRGMEIKSYREKYVIGILEKRELLRHDKFQVQNTIKMYGTKKRTETVRNFFILFG